MIKTILIRFSLFVAAIVIISFFITLLKYVDPKSFMPSFMPFGTEYPFKGTVIRPPANFEEQVEYWADEINLDTPAPTSPNGIKGNCLPVAAELQARIIRAGHDAHIILIDSTPGVYGNHAIVLFDLDGDNILDSVIDNGASTKRDVLPREVLDNGSLGEYFGVCFTLNPQSMKCHRVGRKL